VVKKLIYMESLKFHPDTIPSNAALNATASEVINSKQEAMVSAAVEESKS
jgi:hypothetical protein